MSSCQQHLHEVFCQALSAWLCRCNFLMTKASLVCIHSHVLPIKRRAIVTFYFLWDNVGGKYFIKQGNYFISCCCCHNFYHWKATVFINDKKEVKLVSYWSFKTGYYRYMLPWAIRNGTWL